MLESLFDTSDRERLMARLSALRPDSERCWGRMTAHQAVCHLSDTFRAMLGDRPLPSREIDWKRKLMRFAAFTSALPWPEGAPTSPGLDAEKEGTRPADFGNDLGELRDLVDRFVATGGRGLAPHWAWGTMTRGVWGRYGWRHLNHHLRQFGV